MLFNTFNYIKRSIKQISQKFQRKKVAYSLINVEYCSQTGEPILCLQCENKNYFVKKHLSIFLNQTDVWTNFDRNDFEKIIELKTIWKLAPELQLISHYTKNNTTYIVLRDKEGQILIEELNKTGRSKEFLDKLSPKNAYLLGYLLANEDQSQTLAD